MPEPSNIPATFDAPVEKANPGENLASALSSRPGEATARLVSDKGDGLLSAVDDGAEELAGSLSTVPGGKDGASPTDGGAPKGLGRTAGGADGALSPMPSGIGEPGGPSGHASAAASAAQSALGKADGLAQEGLDGSSGANRVDFSQRMGEEGAEALKKAARTLTKKTPRMRGYAAERAASRSAKKSGGTDALLGAAGGALTLKAARSASGWQEAALARAAVTKGARSFVWKIAAAVAGAVSTIATALMAPLLAIIVVIMVAALVMSVFTTVLGWFQQNGDGSYSALPETERAIAVYLHKQGVTNMEIAAILGNFYGESGVNPKRVEEGKGLPSELDDMSDELLTRSADGEYIGYGLAQWSQSRALALHAFAQGEGRHDSDLQGQLDFFWSEITTSYAGVLEYMRDAPELDGEDGMVWRFMQTFEKPGDPYGALPTRAEAAQRYYDMMIASASGDPDTIVGFAQSKVGCWYYWGSYGDMVDGYETYDCSGFVCAALDAAGVSHDGVRTSEQIHEAGTEVPAEDAQPGDIVCFWRGEDIHEIDCYHVGVYIGDGQVIDANGTRYFDGKVQIDPITGFGPYCFVRF